MHLKKVEIQGFKSFADKIEIDFKEGITAIVGPNGSGKSNISDAIRWVLGEQSVKTLRGNRMEDVIFSGTNSRKALGFAEVSIVFDNKDGLIPVDYQEVAITRRMFRSGESEYYINKNSCRLRDIKEMFMDTGIGKDGYSIIGQGKVDEILSSRPEDRRIIFEEAAGIVKYKTKKEMSEKKLEKTNENLIRIEDILRELKRQLDYLKEQSEKAKLFMELSSELEELEVNLFIRQINELEEKIKEIQEEKSKVQMEIDIISNNKEKIEGKFNLMKDEIEKLDTSINTLQNQAMEIIKELNQKTNDAKLYKEQEKFLIKDRDRIYEEIDDLDINKENKIFEKEVLQKENIKLEEKLILLKKEYTEKNNQLMELNKKIQEKEKQIEKEKNQLIDSNNLISNKKNKISNFSSFEDNIIGRIKQLEREIDVLEDSIENSKILIKEIEEIEREKNKETINVNKSLTQLGIEETKYSEELNELYKDINKLKVELQGNISNYNLLKNMEEDYEGYYKSVKNLMLRCKNNQALEEKLIGIVVDLIKVEEKYEKAIDVALGGSLQNIVTKNEEDAKFIIDYLRENKLGRITFLPLSTIKGNPINISEKDRENYNILGLGSELIKYDNEYKNIMEYLLGRTIIVKDLQDGIAVAKRFGYRYKITTLEGDVINAGGSMTGGSMPRVSGNLLNRRLRLDNLKKEINRLSYLKNKVEKEIKDTKLKLDEITNNINFENNNLQKLNIEMVKIENEKNKELTELDRNLGFIKKYNEEISKLNKELIEIRKNKSQFIEEIKLLEEKTLFLKESIEDFVLKFNDEKVIRDEFTNIVNELKLEINLLENKWYNNKEKVDIIIEEIENLEIIKENKLVENEKNKENIKYLIDKTVNMEKDIKLLSKEEEDKNNKLTMLKNEKNSLMKDYYLEQENLKKTNEELSKNERLRNNWSIKETKYSMELNNINKKLLEDYELNYYEALKLWIEIENLDYANNRVKKLKNEIKKLENVDLSSIEEYKKIRERFEFISKQHGDLLSAKKDLEDVIIDMENKMKEQFLYNFNLINKEFNQVFSILFDGGKAELILENENDILNCGIEIIAQPPGKKLQNLNLLSGGEKSLTAVALLFAILQIKPTPFCILDEIDAALDEANINRYTNYLKSLSHETQFIMITHRKSTMEMADILYGVTMEEEGISKIISVKLTDNLEEIAS